MVAYCPTWPALAARLPPTGARTADPPTSPGPVQRRGGGAPYHRGHPGTRKRLLRCAAVQSTVMPAGRRSAALGGLPRAVVSNLPVSTPAGQVAGTSAARTRRSRSRRGWSTSTRRCPVTWPGASIPSGHAFSSNCCRVVRGLRTPDELLQTHDPARLRPPPSALLRLPRAPTDQHRRCRCFDRPPPEVRDVKLHNMCGRDNQRSQPDRTVSCAEARSSNAARRRGSPPPFG